MNPFDLWEGANFKIKIRQVEGYRNYDKSEFDDVAPLADNDEEMEAIWRKAHSLAEQIAPDKFKTPEKLKASLDRVLRKSSGAATKAVEDDSPYDTSADEEVAAKASKAAPKKIAEKKSKAAPKKDADDDEGDPMDFLNNIIDDDE